MLLTMDYFLIFFLAFIIVLVIAIASYLIFRHVKCNCCRKPRKKEESITYASNPMFYRNMNLLRRFGKFQQGNTPREPPKPMGAGFYTAPPTLSADHFQVTGEPMFFANNIHPTPSTEWIWGYLFGLAAAEEGDYQENCFNNQCTVYTMSSATNTWPAVNILHGAQTNFDVMVAANSSNTNAQQAGSSESASMGDAAGAHSCADGSQDAGGSAADCGF